MLVHKFRIIVIKDWLLIIKTIQWETHSVRIILIALITLMTKLLNTSKMGVNRFSTENSDTKDAASTADYELSPTCDHREI